MKSGFDGRGTTASTPAATALAVVAALLLTAAPAAAQVRGNAQQEQSQGLRGQSLNRALPAPGRYAAESGEGFLIGRSGSTALFRFQRRNETWLLRPSPAPRGDTIYRNDAGAQILRVTPGGAITLYTARAPGGTPASRVGEAPDLGPPTIGPVQLFALMAQRSALVSRALGRLININLTGERDEALCVEALVVTTEAVARMARSAATRDHLERLQSITIVEGDRASVSYVRGELRVTVDPDQGASGRPSSARVIQTVAASGR